MMALASSVNNAREVSKINAKPGIDALTSFNPQYCARLVPYDLTN